MGVGQFLLQMQQRLTVVQRLPERQCIRNKCTAIRFHIRSVVTMDILITHGGLARTRSFHVGPLQLGVIVATFVLAMMMMSGTIYHFIFLKAAREGWPVVSHLTGLVVRDETEQRDRFLRENLDAMAQKVGEMQAKVVKLEAMGERVAGLAGIKPEELRVVETLGEKPLGGGEAATVEGGRGGPYVPVSSPSMVQLNSVVDALELQAARSGDVFTLTESRLLERRLEMMMVPSAPPVRGPIGSGFGFRLDPFTRHAALHTGLDFPAPQGTPIHAAAGGVVLNAESQGAYGQAVEIDHGNGLVTRYAHTSKFHVRPGEVVRRGQLIANVGNTGRSTGAHLHFEVLLNGVQQNPARFLARGEDLSLKEQTAEASPERRSGKRKTR
nr:M23 family metallopeptidase [Leptothrix cholodnii]